MEVNAIEMVDKAIARWGKIDILVNNAGGGVILPFLKLKTTIERNFFLRRSTATERKT